MDGDVASLDRLVELKRRYTNVMLYVDEAHGIAVRGQRGLGVAEEQGCLKDIDFLCGTFGKAMASVGAYVVCRKVIRDYLVNRMRTLIFTTALHLSMWHGRALSCRTWKICRHGGSTWLKSQRACGRLSVRVGWNVRRKVTLFLW